MQVWRLQTNTDGGDVAKFCLDKSVIAMGWQLDEIDREALKLTPTYEKFCEFADKHYEGYSSVRRMARETVVGDIVWMKNRGQYYFARISENSKWQFDFSDEAIRLDATNQLTNVYWHLANESGDESSVPGCLTTGFIRGSTFQRINKSGINEYSQMLFNMKVADGEGFRYPNPSISLNENNFWDLLQPDDAEDLLCMWLYKEKRYIVIPSTNKRGTELYECVLIAPEADDYKHVYIQVKKGNVDIDANAYSSLNGEVYFLTTEGTVLNADKPNYTVVSPKTIYDFAINPENQMLIPEGIARWIQFLTESEVENMDKSSIKGIMFDTNRAYSKVNELEMLSQNRVCAYGDASRFVNRFNKGDYVLFYSKGIGIIAIGRVTSEIAGEVPDGSGLYQEVKMLVPANGDYSHVYDKYISPREIKELLDRGFYFASTIKTPYLNKQQVDILVKALEEQYK